MRRESGLERKSGRRGWGDTFFGPESWHMTAGVQNNTHVYFRLSVGIDKGPDSVSPSMTIKTRDDHVS